MNRMLLVTLEILVVVVLPLLILYLRGEWPLRTTLPCLLIIPVLWYLTYSPLHELGHIVGTYLAGGTVVQAKLIPSFWIGEYGRAWITPEGLNSTWQKLFMTSFPYLLDIVFVVAAYLLLHNKFLKHAFGVGFLFMLLSLRPTFDFICETVAFSLGDKGDLYHIATTIGKPMVWTLMVLCIGYSAYIIMVVLKRYRTVPAM